LLLGAAKTAPIEPFTGVNVPVPADLPSQVLLLWHDLLIARRSRGNGRQRGTSRAGVPFLGHAPARPASRSPSGLPHAGGISACPPGPAGSWSVCAAPVGPNPYGSAGACRNTRPGP